MTSQDTDLSQTETLGEDADRFEGVYPDQDVAGAELQGLVDRAIPLLVIYTGGFEHVYSYSDQFRDMFPNVKFGTLLTLKHHPRADHLFTILEDRDELLSDIKIWSDQYFALGKQAPVDEVGAIIPPENDSTLQLNEAIEVDHETIEETNTDLKAATPRSLIDIIREIDSHDLSAVAIEDNGRCYTYDYLKKHSHGLAHVLAQKSVGRGSILGLCLDRSPALIIGLSGVLRTGAAYLPLDPHYPSDRLQTMIELSQCRQITLPPPPCAYVRRSRDRTHHLGRYRARTRNQGFCFTRNSQQKILLT